MLTKALLHGTASFAVGKTLAFILKLLIARLGAPQFGLYYFATETARNASVFAAFGIPMSASRFLGYYRGANRKTDDIVSSAYTLTAIFGVVTSILLYITAPIITGHLGSPDAVTGVRIASLAVMGGSLVSLAKAIMFGHLDSKRANMYEVADLVAKFILTITGYVLSENRVLGGILGYAIASILTGIALSLDVIGRTRVHIHFSWSRLLTSYAWPVGMSEVITTATGIGILYMLSVSGGASAVGILGIGMTIASLIFFVPQFTLPVFLPSLTTTYRKGISITNDINTASLFITIPTAILAIGIITVSPVALPLLVGTTYREAITPVTILVIAHWLYVSLVWIPRQVIDMLGKTRLNLVLTILRSSVVITVGWLLIPGVGSVGAAWAILSGWCIEAVTVQILSRRVLRSRTATRSA